MRQACAIEKWLLFFGALPLWSCAYQQGLRNARAQCHCIARFCASVPREDIATSCSTFAWVGAGGFPCVQSFVPRCTCWNVVLCACIGSASVMRSRVIAAEGNAFSSNPRGIGFGLAMDTCCCSSIANMSFAVRGMPMIIVFVSPSCIGGAIAWAAFKCPAHLYGRLCARRGPQQSVLLVREYVAVSASPSRFGWQSQCRYMLAKTLPSRVANVTYPVVVASCCKWAWLGRRASRRAVCCVLS